jgi:hypothetical protein
MNFRGQNCGSASPEWGRHLSGRWIIESRADRSVDIGAPAAAGRTTQSINGFAQLATSLTKGPPDAWPGLFVQSLEMGLDCALSGAMNGGSLGPAAHLNDREEHVSVVSEYVIVPSCRTDIQHLGRSSLRPQDSRYRNAQSILAQRVSSHDGLGGGLSRHHKHNRVARIGEVFIVRRPTSYCALWI